MHICHITPHVPPDQAANALLPYHLGHWALASGDEVSYVSRPPRAGHRVELPGEVTWIADARSPSGVLRLTRLDSLLEARRITRAAAPAIARADIVHVHSNGLLAEVGALAAARAGKPVVLTLYGTEIWHYRPRRLGPDLFTRAYRTAAAVTFYSQRLMDRATELGLDRPGLHTVYPPVAGAFMPAGADERVAIRRELGIQRRHLLLNVKRLHPLAGQHVLVDALPIVMAERPDTVLVICGTGPLLDDLRRRAKANGVGEAVVFAGLQDNAVVAQYCRAADLFVLPSLLEALPTVAVEALACATPVVSSDNPGGLELHGLFGDDVRVVPGEDPEALARALLDRLAEGRRTGTATDDTVARLFRPPAVAARYRAIYDEVL